jgi:hypothetical protein
MWHFGPAHSVAAFQRKSSGICSVGITERYVVCPDTRGGPSETTCLRTFDHSPSAPINSRPVTRSPFASRAVTDEPS